MICWKKHFSEGRGIFSEIYDKNSNLISERIELINAANHYQNGGSFRNPKDIFSENDTFTIYFGETLPYIPGTNTQLTNVFFKNIIF